MSDEKKGTVTFTPPPAIRAALEEEAAAMGYTLADFLKGFFFQAARDPNGATIKLDVRKPDAEPHPELALGAAGDPDQE